MADPTDPTDTADPTGPAKTGQVRAEHRDGEWKVERLDEAPTRGVFDLGQLSASVYAGIASSARLHGHSVQDEVRHILVGHQRRALARGQLRQAITELLLEELS
jgi:hypothetical protein